MFRISSIAGLTIVLSSIVVLAGEHTMDSLETVKKATTIEKTAILVDVREEDEWTEGHVRGATFLPLSLIKEADQATVEKRLPKDKVVYTHCRAGRRSVAAAEVLKKYGYDVRPLKPGFEEIAAFGFETEEGPPK